jgi:hypothetical protein
VRGQIGRCAMDLCSTSRHQSPSNCGALWEICAGFSECTNNAVEAEMGI